MPRILAGKLSQTWLCIVRCSNRFILAVQYDWTSLLWPTSTRYRICWGWAFLATSILEQKEDRRAAYRMIAQAYLSLINTHEGKGMPEITNSESCFSIDGTPHKTPLTMSSTKLPEMWSSSSKYLWRHSNLWARDRKQPSFSHLYELDSKKIESEVESDSKCVSDLFAFT